MTIQKRIDLLKPYFKGIRVAEDYRIVEFNLKKTWVIPEDDDIDVEQKSTNDGNNILYNMFYTNSKTFDELLDYVENQIINYNLEIEQKEELLRMKVEELKRVFENKGLDELNSLKFITEDGSLRLNSKPNTKKETGVDNTELEENKNGVTKELSTNS
jgi:hypothetical protein